MYRFVCLMLIVSAVSCHSVAEKVDARAASAIDPSEVETVKNTDEFGDVEEYSRKKSDYARHGDYTKYGSEGNLVEKAFYINDTLHGTRILYGEKADTQIVENYEMGRFEGPFLAYYENGQLELSGEYADNTMSGEWKRFYKTGELMEVVAFKDNKENGPFIEYYENGNIKAEGEYLDGDHEHGLLKMYNEAGVLVKKMQCDKGICSTIWELGKGN